VEKRFALLFNRMNFLDINQFSAVFHAAIVNCILNFFFDNEDINKNARDRLPASFNNEIL